MELYNIAASGDSEMIDGLKFFSSCARLLARA